MAVATIVSRTAKPSYGDDTNAYADYQKGDVLTIVGVDGASRDVPAVAPDGLGAKGVGVLTLNTPTGSGVNTFLLPAGIHGQELWITFGTKTGGNAVVSPLVASSMFSGVATAVATITMTAAGKFAFLRYLVNRWVVVFSDATLA